MIGLLLEGVILIAVLSVLTGDDIWTYVYAGFLAFCTTAVGVVLAMLLPSTIAIAVALLSTAAGMGFAISHFYDVEFKKAMIGAVVYFALTIVVRLLMSNVATVIRRSLGLQLVRLASRAASPRVFKVRRQDQEVSEVDKPVLIEIASSEPDGFTSEVCRQDLKVLKIHHGIIVRVSHSSLFVPKEHVKSLIVDHEIPVAVAIHVQ